jgi:uncharacterized protein
MIEAQIEQDLKSAMLAKESDRVSTLRGLKSAFLYAKVANGTKDKPLSDEVAMVLLQKESKKRIESAELYKQGGANVRAEKELDEKKIIDSYLPEKIDENELTDIITVLINSHPDFNMGQIIGEVRQITLGRADGSDIARIVKGKLEK